MALLEVRNLFAGYGKVEVISGISLILNLGSQLALLDQMELESPHYYRPSLAQFQQKQGL